MNQTMNIDDPVQPKRTLRRFRLAVFFALILLAGAGAGFNWWQYSSVHEDTDDAYVAGDVVQLNAQIPGTVTEVLADNTRHVRAGEVLVRLDDAEVAASLEQAKAQLAQAVTTARGARLNQKQLKAVIEGRRAELALARQALKARSDAASEVVTAEELAHAREAVDVAQASLDAATGQLTAARASSGNQPADKNPSVLLAASQLKLAYINYRRATVSAPVEGVVAQRSVQIGQRVAPGVPLLSIISLGHLWVEANFKESQLRHLGIGQPVTLTSDLYDANVVFHGHIEGMSAGTGSAFSMLPPQNASGNWIKVVQRVPVRVTLDPEEVAKHPLRIGLSMDAEVDVTDRDGKSLADAPRDNAAVQTQVYAVPDDEATALINRVISANVGHPVRLSKAAFAAAPVVAQNAH